MSLLQRHNVSIPVILSTTGTFTAFLTCPFLPDELKLKNLTFSHSDPPTVGVFTVQVAGLGPGGSPGGVVLGAVIDPCTSFSGITVPLTNFTPGTYAFSMYVDNDPVGILLNGAQLNILLEFRRYVR